MRGLFFLGFQNWLPIMVTHKSMPMYPTLLYTP
jgi:hypothetical protein